MTNNPGPMIKNRDLLERYKLGKWCLDRRAAVMASSCIDAHNWDSLAKGQPARALMERLAKQRKVSFVDLKSASNFAEAVDKLLANCGSEAFETLFSGDTPQTEKAILKLSRTSDVRQRHRVSGVQAGQFRSVAPQPSDLVFDTVVFKEVTSRLGRGRGALEKLKSELGLGTDPFARKTLIRLMELVRKSTLQLRKLVNSKSATAPQIPDNLEKTTVWGELESLAVRNKQTGQARLALRFIIKCVWDYPEMRRRQIAPTASEREQALRELRVIAGVAASLQAAAQSLEAKKK